MNFKEAISSGRPILTEGAIIERLKNEFNITLDEFVNHAGLIYDPHLCGILKRIYEEYMDVAADFNLPIMLMTPTRRANKTRVQQSAFYNKNLNRDCVIFLKELLGKRGRRTQDIYIGGLMGCKGDAYSTNEILSVIEAHEFHSWQANLFCEAGVDYLFAGIMPGLTEAIGMSMAMSDTGIPYIISFMIRSNGRLLDGTNIHDAITQIDSVAEFPPVCYMTNCVHPTILDRALSAEPNNSRTVKDRFFGIQANTSALQPEELNNSLGLRAEGPEIFAKHMEDLNKRHHLKIFGGCCGTNKLHIEKIAFAIKNNPGKPIKKSNE